MRYAVARVDPSIKPQSARVLEGGLIELVAQFREQVVLEALRSSGWNITRAALELGVGRTSLHKLMASLHITRPAAFTAPALAEELR